MGMDRRSATLVLVFVLAGCSTQSGAPGDVPTGSQTASNGGGATSGPATTSGTPADGGGSLAEAAAKVTDWCALIPNDVVARFAPSAPPAAAGTYPGECGASNGVGALDFRYTTGFGAFETPSGAEPIPGLAQGAYVNRPSQDEVELTVALQADPEVSLFIDVAGHDGKDHTDDAVDIAKAIIAKLGG
jgi:hypothetical protein